MQSIIHEYEAALVEEHLSVQRHVVKSISILTLDGKQPDDVFVERVARFAKQLLAEMLAAEILGDVDFYGQVLVVRDVGEPELQIRNILGDVDEDLRLFDVIDNYE